LREEKASQKNKYKSRAAKKLAISLSSLYAKIEEYGLTEFGRSGTKEAPQRRFKA
jgi:DNA-binding NtrC family response regulator